MSNDQAAVTTTGPGWPDDDWQIQAGGDPLWLITDCDHDGPVCGERRHMFTCSRPAGHKPRHIATGVLPHLLLGVHVMTDQQGRSKVLEVWS